MSPLPHSVRHRHSSSSAYGLVAAAILLLSWSSASLADSYSRQFSDRQLHAADEPATWRSTWNWWTPNDDAHDDSSLSFTADELEYIRRLLTFALHIRRTPVGSVISSDESGSDAHLMPAVIASLVDRFRSIDFNALARQIIAENAQMSAWLEKMGAKRAAAAAAGSSGSLLPPMTREEASSLVDWPWLPKANLSECSKDYSQFVDPITNRIWEIVRNKLCEEAPVGCALIPPVPNTPMPSWGWKMIDAMGKIPEGLSEIKLHFVGAFDMCNALEIEYNLTTEDKNTEYRQFNGQYCRISILPSYSRLNLTDVTIPIALMLGVCTPDTCSRKEVANYIEQDNELLHIILKHVFDNATIPIVYCGQELDPATDIAFQTTVGIMGGIIILIIISTIYDGCFRKRKLEEFLMTVPIPQDVGRHTSNTDSSSSSTGCSCSTDCKTSADDRDTSTKFEHSDKDRICSYELVKNMRHLTLRHRMELFVLGFSAYTNLRKIFNTRPKPNHLPMLNGMRYMSYIWTILGMSYFLGPVYHECIVTANTFTMLRTYPQEFKMQVVLNFHIASDTFLFISGTLVTYWFLKQFEEGGKQLKIITFVIYGVRKYWRLVPGIMMSLMFYTSTYRYFADGPVFPTDISDGDNCRVNWWVDLLMVQNLVRIETMCLSWLFNVAITLQLQIAAIVVLVPLALKPVFGYIMVAVMWIAHIITTALLTHKYRSEGDIEGTVNGYLFTPWCRAGPFVVGLALGIILHKVRKVKMHLVVNLLGWLVALCTMGAVVFSSYSEYKEGGERWSASAMAAYDTLARSAWGVAIGWVVFACHYGYGGVINTFLSWGFFWPLSKLVYCSLLTHAIMILRYVYSNRQLLYIEQYHMLYLIFGNLTYTFFIGLIWALMFHYPLSIGIDRTILTRNMKDFLRAGRHPRTVKRIKPSDNDNAELHKSPPPPSNVVFSDPDNFDEMQKTFRPSRDDLSPAPSYHSTSPPLDVDVDQLKF